jgi:hypothetical protein
VVSGVDVLVSVVSIVASQVGGVMVSDEESFQKVPIFWAGSEYRVLFGMTVIIPLSAVITV